QGTELVAGGADHGSGLGCRDGGERRRVSGVGTEGPEEAGPFAGVAGPSPLLLDHEQERVTVAVVVRLADELAVARGLALAPVLLARAAPEPGAAGLEGALQGLVVH